MCRLLSVFRSDFYYELDKPAGAHECENAQLLKAVKHSHEANVGTYGSPRVVRDLIDMALQQESRSTAEKAAGIACRHEHRSAPEQLASPVHAIASNMLGRQFEAIGPKQKWAADLTYVWTVKAGYLSLWSLTCTRSMWCAGRCNPQ